MRSLAALLLVLAACPAKQPETPQPAQVAGVGCPKASDIYLAQYLRPDTFSAQEAASPQGYSGWTLPLAHSTEAPSAGALAFQTLDPAAATSLAIPPAPQTVWLMLPTGLCKATVGSYYSAAVPTKAPTQTRGVSLAGCAEPKEGEDEIAIALVSVEPPAQCVPVSPQQAGARMGTEGPNNAWVPPTNRGTPIPPAVAQQITPHTCTAPDCETLWSIGKIDANGKTIAYAGAVNWAQTNGSRDACTWTYEGFSNVYAVEPDGSLSNLNLMTSKYQHPLSLTVALADNTGPKALILDGPGEYATFDIGAGPATLGRHLLWFWADAEAYQATDRLLPTCGK